MENRDIGYLQGSTQVNIPIDNIKRTQVYQVTHDGAGKRLPFMNRSFISFTYGGKAIEDFNMVATINGDRLSHSVYADFTDNVTDSNIFDGQLYWSSHFNANIWDLTLSTDGMTENQLNEFKKWFIPGKIRELILAEHPNRAIMARISKAPVYSMVPFEESANVVLAGETYQTSTTMYKGDISLSFVMDDPFWYAISNIIDKKDPTSDTYNHTWIDANNERVHIVNSTDALKIILEDNVPSIAMLPQDINILIGSGKLFTTIDEPSPYGSLIGYAIIDGGHVAYVYIDSDSSISLGTSSENTVVDPGYFYYGGTAPCAPTITFTLTPQLSDGYIISPKNDIAINSSGKQYNSLIIESVNKKQLDFTTPNVYTGFNQAVKIFKTVGVGASWEDVKVLLRDQVKHYAPRKYAIAVVESLKTGTTTTASVLNSMITEMANFLKDVSTSTILPVTFTIDCKTGKAIANMQYRNENLTSPSLLIKEENVGDMILSNYLLIEDRNYFTDSGTVSSWSDEHPEYGHRVYADVAGGLSNFNINYKFLYL